MKKLLLLFLTLALTLSLAACGSSGEPAQEETGISQVEALATFAPDFDMDQAQQMNNANFYGMALVEDGVFYGRFWLKDVSPWQFVKMELVPDPQYSSYITSGEWSVLQKDIVPQYINKSGDILYYIAQDWTQGDTPVTKVARISVDGQDQADLADGNGYLTVRGDRLYFTDGDDRYVSTDLEGGDKQVIIDKAVFYPYFLDDDWILYQDDADNESLHLYSVSTGVDVKLNDEPSYNPVLYGSYLYFCTRSAEVEGAFNVCRMGLVGWTVKTDEATGKEVPVFPMEKSDTLCGGKLRIDRNEVLQGLNNANGVSLDYWDQYEDDGYGDITMEYIYLSEPVDIYIEYRDDAMGIFFSNNATGYSQTIRSLR